MQTSTASKCPRSINKPSMCTRFRLVGRRVPQSMSGISIARKTFSKARLIVSTTFSRSDQSATDSNQITGILGNYFAFFEAWVRSHVSTDIFCVHTRGRQNAPPSLTPRSSECSSERGHIRLEIYMEIMELQQTAHAAAFRNTSRGKYYPRYS